MIQETPTLELLKVIDQKLDKVLLLLSGKQKGPEAELVESDDEDDPNYITVRDS